MRTRPRAYEEMVQVPRRARFPIELQPPSNFVPEDSSTWPKVPGRLEYVGGKLVYTTPCGDVQQDVVSSIVGLLDRWLDDHPEFVLGTNEAGMLLGDDVRAADVTVWRRNSVGPHTGRYRRVPPVLAVEVAGQGEGELELREKAGWYLGHGVSTVWLVLPESREMIVLRSSDETRHGAGDSLPADPALPGLLPVVAVFFKQLR